MKVQSKGTAESRRTKKRCYKRVVGGKQAQNKGGGKRDGGGRGVIQQRDGVREKEQV